MRSGVVVEAQAGFGTWRETDPVERAAIISRASELMRERRDELAGVVIRENGKNWRDADADVCEAIDFCEYYARQIGGAVSAEAAGAVCR